MGPGFGINIGNFALPNIDLEDLDAGIASSVARYLAEQDLSNSTNEFEKDVAENVIDQITDFESGIGSLPPVVEQVLSTMMPQDKAIEAVSDRDFPTFAEPRAPMSVDLQETIRNSLDKAAAENAAITQTSAPAAPASVTLPDIFNLTKLVNKDVASNLISDLGIVNTSPAISTINKIPTESRFGEFTDIQTLPDNTTVPRDTGSFFRRLRTPPPSPISNLIRQQRQAYNTPANQIYNPAPPQQQTTFVRPMSAAEFGSRPGEEPQTNFGFMSMRGGGAMKLPNSPMNMGLAGLPSMQQNDKLTELFAQSFSPRR